ncbi:hypothetical protein [Pontivivens ytuae]|uniref:Uncharacterized protein n=1 Tax=Pontivivens ytuae TaxID=2789856 RepID=A0A7S9LR30_9RHOB|nr:hypothetical protein [Pontivivens ytuae]QPH53739.1 hypothetical protein I0K15_18480 [Pontivivens ytuae]
MSTVLWANVLHDGTLSCNEEDLLWLLKFSKDLDKISAKLGQPPFSELFDHTDMQVNMDVTELPDGMEDTRELMIRDGVWVPLEAAADRLRALLDHLRSAQPRLGTLRDRRADVEEELDMALRFVEQYRRGGARFNFAVVG